MVLRDDIVRHLDLLLTPPDGLKDHSNNGLQVEGEARIERIAGGVDASVALFNRAREWGAQLLLVHHGLSWGSGFARLVGRDAERFRILLTGGISLYASHVPLDCHPELGNNAVIAERLGLRNRQVFGIYGGVGIGYRGTLPRPMSLRTLVRRVETALETTCRVLDGSGKDAIRTVGVISGGGADIVSQCPAAGVDCLITGEMVHQSVHPAWEAGTAVIAAGHYATEVWGVRALLDHLATQFPVTCTFIDLPTGF